jgi:hypothetical protein
MAYNQQTAFFDHIITDEEFYSVIERLKIQGALPRDTFVKEIPFFTFGNITKESQLKELFQDSCDPQTYKNLLKNIMINPDENGSTDMLSKRLSVMQVMSFAQIVMYKVLPCPDENCSNRPREIATHNQYKDYEYQCPFYHHDRDRRRIVIAPNIGEEFVFKANYFEDGKRSSEKYKYSQNYFESMFHPLYYKMFRCKRDYCNFSQLCPFYHSEEEKKTWDRTFSNYIRKDRISYVKDKQKYYEKQENRKKQNSTQNSNQEEKTTTTSTTTSGKSDRNRKGFNRRGQGQEKTFTPFEEKTSERPFHNKFFEDWNGGLESHSPKSTDSKDTQVSKASSKENHKYLTAIKVN